MNELLLNSLAVAVIVTTITRGAILKSFRDYFPGFFNKLFNCPYCLAHWVSIPFGLGIAINAFDFIIITLSLIAISSLPTFLLIKYLRWLDDN